MDSRTYGGRGPEILGIAWMEASIASILVVVRVYCKWFLRGHHRFDSTVPLYWALWAWVSTASLGISKATSMTERSQFNYRCWR